MEQSFLQSYIRQILLYKYTILIWLILTPAKDKLARAFPKPMLLSRSKIVAQRMREHSNFSKNFKQQTKKVTQDGINKNRMRFIRADQPPRKLPKKNQMIGCLNVNHSVNIIVECRKSF